MAQSAVKVRLDLPGVVGPKDATDKIANGQETVSLADVPGRTSCVAATSLRRGAPQADWRAPPITYA